MNETKLKIMEMLDKEGLVDKELKSGCIIELGSYKSGEYLIYQGERILKNGLWTYASRGDKWLSACDDSDYEIIGQYHLGNILQWFWKNKKTRFNNRENVGRVMAMLEEHTDKYLISLDSKTPPMERSEEQDKELLEFMQTVLDNK